MRVFSFLFGITRSSIIKVRIKLSTAIAQSYVCVGVGGGGGLATVTLYWYTSWKNLIFLLNIFGDILKSDVK